MNIYREYQIHIEGHSREQVNDNNGLCGSQLRTTDGSYDKSSDTIST